MLSSIQTYHAELPSEYMEAVSRSAFYSFFISAIRSGSGWTGLYSAGLAVTASLVGSLIMPILKKQWGDPQHRLNWKAITAISLSGVGLMVYFSRVLNVPHINFFASAFFTLLAIDLAIGRNLFNTKKYGPIFILVV